MGQLNKTIRSKYVYYIYALFAVAIIVLIVERWYIGSIFLIAFLILYVYDVNEEKKIRKRRVQDILQLSLKVEKREKTCSSICPSASFYITMRTKSNG